MFSAVHNFSRLLVSDNCTKWVIFLLNSLVFSLSLSLCISLTLHPISTFNFVNKVPQKKKIGEKRTREKTLNDVNLVIHSASLR